MSKIALEIVMTIEDWSKTPIFHILNNKSNPVDAMKMCLN